MGYINNQWLNGTPRRHRYHSPTQVAVKTDSLSEWDIKHNVKGCLLLERRNGDYQVLRLCEKDFRAFEKIVHTAEWNTRRKIALAALRSASASEIVEFMKALFGAQISES